MCTHQLLVSAGHFPGFLHPLEGGDGGGNRVRSHISALLIIRLACGLQLRLLLTCSVTTRSVGFSNHHMFKYSCVVCTLFFFQPAGNNHPCRLTPGAGAWGHSEGVGSDLAEALCGTCRCGHVNWRSGVSLHMLVWLDSVRQGFVALLQHGYCLSHLLH